MTEINYYFNEKHPLHPYNGQSHANKGSYAPLDALRIKPEFKEGFHPCEKNGRWILLPDHRGEKVYDKVTAKKVEIIEIGGLTNNLTTISPNVPFPKWDGKKWVTNSQAMKVDQINKANQEKSQLLEETESKIRILERKVRLGMGNNIDASKLRDWEIYSLKINDLEISTAPDIDWPKKPD